ncbi:ROK family protein [Simiduia agarivorans]|uniref:ROK family protein n=1 Tax=Simiduia agarivorans (strain DSM 21679 / JCM 13881 / BCRC 17597 / SA1) TaxID=1117647 RepID=K4KN44_SIMAS|nr:ROK family protein [Simiduia agarivorans]AFV00452.1 ROK family protein [Simiduia agarivorans SA1 = DSM 21679]
MSGYLLGVDIGGTKCALVLATINGELLRREVLNTNTSQPPMETLKQLAALARERFSPDHLTSLRAIGISCGGPLDSARGLVLSPPNLPGWDAVPVTRFFSNLFGVPAALQNDANAGALAEWRFGAGKGSRNMVFLTFGTGLGAGLILNGQLYSGTNDLAGELGHIRLADSGPLAFGKHGSFEGFCSGAGIRLLGQAAVREAWQHNQGPAWCRTEAELATLTTQQLAQHACAGDALALKVFAESGKRLGQGLSMVIDLLNPEYIVIGSVFARCESFIAPAAHAVIAREALPGAAAVCRVVPAALGEQIGDYAAVGVAQLALSSADKHATTSKPACTASSVWPLA